MSAFTVDQLEADVAFLVARAERAGSFSCNEEGRDFGVSSNALVSLAYGGEQDGWPWDRSDYAACVRAFRKLPAHRRTPTVVEGLHKAREAYLKENPHDRYPGTRKAYYEEAERTRAEWRATRKRSRRKARA